MYNDIIFLFSLQATHPSIYGGAFLQKQLTAKSHLLFFQKSSTIDFWWGSKYRFWQYCQKSSHLKDIFPFL